MTHLFIFTLGSVRSSPPSVRYQHFVRFLHRSDVDESELSDHPQSSQQQILDKTAMTMKNLRLIGLD